MKKRVFELARELNLTTRQMVDYILNNTDFPVKSHMSTLSDDDIKSILKEIDLKKIRNKKYVPKETQPLAINKKQNHSIKIKFPIEAILNVLKKLDREESSETIYTEQDTKDKQILSLKNSLNRKDLVFVLGAGVSADYNLPSWENLLQKLLFLPIQNELNENDKDTKILTKLFTNTFPISPLAIARYIQNNPKLPGKKNTLKFEEMVRRVLYSGINLTDNSKLLNEISMFCVNDNKKPCLDSIITYNFDDLIEWNLSKNKKHVSFKPVHAPGLKLNPNVLPIYHVHGYLPQHGKLTKKNRITLSENIYHQQYTDIYGWSNLVQINKFIEKNCLFIGTSLTDPNLRRLLDIAATQRGAGEISHYCFRKKYKPSDIKYKLKEIVLGNNGILNDKVKSRLDIEKSASSMIKIVERFEINDLKSFGVDLIWIEDFDEIPAILKDIRTKI